MHLKVGFATFDLDRYAPTCDIAILHDVNIAIYSEIIFLMHGSIDPSEILGDKLLDEGFTNPTGVLRLCPTRISKRVH